MQFMDLFKQEVKKVPELPSYEVRALRAKLIFEEAVETINALGFSLVNPHAPVDLERSIELTGDLQPNLVEVADGLADLHYVAYCGTGLACGIDMEPVFQEVHRSNMSKRWTEEDLKRVKELHPTGVVEKYGDGLYRVLVDGKIMKSPSYSPARVAEILDAQIRPAGR